MTKSGFCVRLFTEATAFFSVPCVSGLTLGPENPQCVSVNWTK